MTRQEVYAAIDSERDYQERIKILSESWDYCGTGGFAYDVVRIPKWKPRKLAKLWATFVVYVQRA